MENNALADSAVPSTISPWTIQGFQLLLLGFGTLFLELALIRYLAGNIWNLGYFPNLVLIAVFTGMGIGFIFHQYISSKNSPVFFQLSVILLMTLILFVYYKHPSLPGLQSGQTEIGQELYFIHSAAGGEDTRITPFLFCFLSVILIFALISQRTAKLFRQFRPLTAYTLDISGSCLGILAFMLISFFQVSPTAWFAIFGLIFILAMPDPIKTRWIPLIPLLVIIGYTWQLDSRHLQYPNYSGDLAVSWSPYQRVELMHDPALPTRLRNTIWANGVGHQRIGDKEELLTGFYIMPYVDRQRQNLPPFKKVLIIGAGSGNDSSIAILAGAEKIDAVEIDPVIARFGRTYHPMQPYSDPKVNLIVDDGRAFMTQTDEEYDLIVFAWADSLVRVSSLSQLRLENYLFTEQSIRRAYELLSDDGCIYLFNSFPQPWAGEKLRGMIVKATGIFPKVVLSKTGDFTFFKVGRAENCRSETTVPIIKDTPTDDWPFLHLKTRGIPPLYLKAMLFMVVFIGVLMAFMQFVTRREGQYRGTRFFLIKLAFAFMGVAFMLLETKSIIQFSLLFGTTWLNNSLVFLGVLLLVLAANWTAYLMKGKRWLWLILVLLIGSSLIPLAYPLGNLLGIESFFLRFLLSALLTFSPIYFANLIFSITFRDQAVPEHIFGWNLIGATVGGVLEYLSMVLGYNMLAVVVAACYAFVFLLIMLSGQLKEKTTVAVQGG